ncbi:hypothetical protein V6N11_046107 [Hibiscus sabdariffa]|uniref:Uncharacterized protein n=1 Tax=Hibiscus sabdariffa TaxID=183260 RepID=A0ABR2N7Z6_9ROSI
MLLLLLFGCFNVLPEQDDKGDASIRDNGSCLGRNLGGNSDLGTNSLRANKDKFKKHMDDMLDAVCLVLATTTLELQKQQEYVVSYEMIQNLKEILKGKHVKRGTRPLKTYFNAK